MVCRSKVSVVVYIWYQSEVGKLGPNGLKTLHHVLFELMIEFFSLTPKTNEFALFVSSKMRISISAEWMELI